MRMFCMVLALVAMSSFAKAQLPAGQHLGLWLGMFNTAAGTNAVTQLDSTANNQTVYAFLTAASSAWPYWGNPFGVAQASAGIRRGGTHLLHHVVDNNYEA